MITINKIIRKNDTSYEIIWATLRIDPRWQYFEFMAHPISKIEYVDRVDKMKNIKIECLLSNIEKELKDKIGIVISAIRKDKAGVK